ncbi:MAG: Uma2 family endonuclease [Nocardioidaceae bacterium]|jgi:Uma2 family endonuclease
MVTMTQATWLPRGRALTRDDLDTLPDDGHRYELIDGVLVVSPSPSQEHQSMLGELFVLLRAACPADLKVLLAPFDVALAADTVVQPDIVVARRTDLTSRDLPTAPVLAVEVLSPSTRRIDLTLKKSLQEAAGCPSYWVVDPAEPRLITWDLVGGAYVEVASVAGAETFTAQHPFAVSVTPAPLV